MDSLTLRTAITKAYRAHDDVRYEPGRFFAYSVACAVTGGDWAERRIDSVRDTLPNHVIELCERIMTDCHDLDAMEFMAKIDNELDRMASELVLTSDAVLREFYVSSGSLCGLLCAVDYARDLDYVLQDYIRMCMTDPGIMTDCHTLREAIDTLLLNSGIEL